MLLIFSTLLIVVPIFLRLLNILPLILIGCSLPLFGCFMITNYYTFKPNRIYQDRAYNFEFYKRENWRKSLKYLETVDFLPIEDRKLYPDNFLINDTLNTLIDTIIDNFIFSWSRKISTSKSFDTSVHHVLSFSVKSLIERLNKMDYPDVVVLNLIPIINDHIRNFISANELTKENESLNLNTKNYEEQLVLNFNKGKLHPGLRFNSPTLQDDVKIYLSSLIEKVLPFLLESNEITSRSSSVLVRELLASCVLNPICQILSDPDFLNQSIVETLSKQIKDRNSVKQIRSILRQHSKKNSDQTSNIDLLNYRLKPSSSLNEFLEVASLVEHSKDVETVQKFKVLCLLQKHSFQKGKTKLQIEESRNLKKYVKRIDTLCYFIDSKVRGDTVNWKSFQSIDSASYPYEKYPEIELPDIALESIISSQSRLKYFQFFMQQRGERRSLLDFIIETDGLKNPLEFNAKTGNPTISTLKEDEESSDEETGVFVDKSFSQSEEIISLFKRFFDLSIMKVPPKIYYKVNEYVEGNHDEPLSYNRARRNMLKLRSYEYDRMSKTDFKAFQQSEMWTKMMLEDLSRSLIDTKTVDFNTKEQSTVAIPKTVKRQSYGDPLAMYRENEDAGNYVDVNLTGKVSDKVVQAVEDALSQIVDDQNQLEITGITEQHEKKNSRLVSVDVMSDLFGADNSGLFSDADDSFEESALTSIDATGINNPSNEVYDNDFTLNEEMLSSVDFLPIAPNVLDLSKEILLLEEEISRLREQILIINTLLNKAEVVNNIPECRILRKSLLSLEKEIKLKNLQKEQLKVQEGENSLYQKSDVKITNYVTVKDKSGKAFVMYAIKVLRFSSSDKSECIASWIVTRRFNQFYELHRHLKEIYPEVRKIDFPKKTVMVKFLPSAMIEERQQTLGRYLGKLITIRDVCADKQFRAFLSSETFDLNTKGEQSSASKSSFIDDLSTQALLPLMSLVDKETPEAPDIASNDRSHQNKEKGTVKMNEPSFTKPICDTVILLFQLSKSTNWLRGKGLILLFQQIFGSAIEKTIRKIVDGKIRNEENISLILMGIVSKLFPNGKFKQKSSPRSQFEKANTKQQAKALLALFLNDTTARIFGRNAAREAADLSYAIYQNEFLNKQLILSLIDEVFMCLFPELRQQST